MMRSLILALGLCAASALRIQAKKKEAPLPNRGNSGTISFGKITAPIYDISDEPFQNIEFGRNHGGKTDHDSDGSTDNDNDGPAQGYNGGMTVQQKAAVIAEAMKECTPENSAKAGQENPVGKIPVGFPHKSALPVGSFYAKQAAQHTQATMGCTGDSCQIPTYLAPREEAKESQAIPRIIWMTMSDVMLSGKSGPFQYSMMSEHFKQNPEYEWVVSGDEMSNAFMHSDEVKTEWTQAYDKARNGAEKADIWRYAVLLKYGGVYMDTDMTAVAPYRTFIDSKAQVVQQCTSKGSRLKYETSQYGLFFAPGSKLLVALLDRIAQKFSSGETLPLTIKLTGPGALAMVYMMFKPCGMSSCGEKSPNKVCGLKQESCDDPQLGKVVLLQKVRDFNTGKVWHKSDVCALAETRSKVSHWAQAKGSEGGKGAGFDMSGKAFDETAKDSE